MRLVYAFSFLVLLCSSALAGAPQRIPLQGFLTDSASVPIDTTKQVTFAIYDVATGGTALYSESQAVVVSKGDFTVNVGANVPLDLKLFRNGSLYLGITIQGEAEMSPRLAFGSVPYAAYAEETGAVPPGAVMMFDLDNCPPGWSALDAARGRAIVGVPTGGMRGGTVGTALSDKEDRAHSHGVGPFSATSTLAGAHDHALALGSLTTSSSGSHNHAWSHWNNASKIWSTYGSAGTLLFELIDWTARGGEIGMDTVGGGNHPLAVDDTQPANGHPTQFMYTSLAGGHTHTTPAQSLTTSAVANHQHSINIGATTSTPTTSGMPYLQLLICRKD